ncbi:MAG: inorganic diphosphatase [Vicinamibacterales bacterium]
MRLTTLPAFAETDTLNVVIESPRGSTAKLKFDADQGVMRLSRPLIVGLAYPCDWGFVPSTRGPDGDPIDAFVMWDGTGFSGLVLECRPIGLLRVEQTNRTSGARERNDRVATLPISAPRWASIHTVFDLNERIRQELERFFLSAVAFEGKELQIGGWAGPDEALTLVRASSHITADARR